MTSIFVLAQSVLSAPLEVAGVWGSTIALFSGASAAWTLLETGSSDEVGRSASLGAAVGFIVGFLFASGAAIYLYAAAH